MAVPRPDHDVEVTLVWDRVDVRQPQASDLRLNVLDVGGVPHPNASALSNGNADGIVQPDDNFRHFVFRTTVAGSYTIRVLGVTFRLSEDTDQFRFALSWRSVPAPIDPTPILLPNSTVLGSPSSGVTHPAVGDFNGDSRRDVAANLLGGNAIWWRGPGLQAQPPTGFQGGSRLFTSMVDTDKLDDIVSGVSTTAVVGRGAAPSPFPATIPSTIGAAFDPFRHVVQDLHCPPIPPVGYFTVADLALLAAPPQTDLVVHAGDGTGLFLSSPGLVVTASEFELRGLVAGDFDADGCPDLVAVGVRTAPFRAQPAMAGVLACFRGTGSLLFEDPVVAGTFSYFPEFADSAQSALSMVARDFNGDGRLDVAMASQMRLLPMTVTQPTRLIVYAGDGAGHFSRIAEAPAWFDGTGGPGVATANPFTIRHAVGAEVDGNSPRDVALLGDDAGGASVLRVFAIDSLGRVMRREGYPIAASLGVPTSLAANGNVLGGTREDVVVGGGPNASGNAVVEVRRD